MLCLMDTFVPLKENIMEMQNGMNVQQEIKSVKNLALASAGVAATCSGFLAQRAMSHHRKGTTPANGELTTCVVVACAGTLAITQSIIAVGFLAATKQL